MAIMISGAAIMDAAMLLISAEEECPQPQTREHLAALKALGIKKLIVIQNKVDLISRDQAEKQYEQIKKFVESTLGFEVPVIPVSAVKRINIGYVLEAIQELFPTPERSKDVDPIMFIVRSFDVNKPGAEVEKLNGGVVGGSIVQGEFEVGKEIEIVPGLKTVERNQTIWKPISTKITGIVSGSTFVDKKGAGGLVAFSTLLDPVLTKSDFLSGNIVAYKGKSWPVRSSLKLKISLFDKVIGMKDDAPVIPLKIGEGLMISAGTTNTLGMVGKVGSISEVSLKKPICAENNSKVALSRNYGGHWRLIGFGEIAQQ